MTQALVAPALLGAWAAGRLARSFRPDAKRTDADSGWVRLALGLLVAALLAALPLGVRDIARDYTTRSQGIELGMARAPVIVPRWQARAIHRLVKAICEDVPAGEPIFVAPYAPGLYFLAERPNPTRHDAIVPGFATPAIQQEVIEGLERERVRLVVINLTRTGGLARWWLPSVAPQLWRHLIAHYERKRTIGNFVFLRRKATEPTRPHQEAAPCRKTRPGRTSSCTPASTATRPLISTQSMPTGCWRGAW